MHDPCSVKENPVEHPEQNDPNLVLVPDPQTELHDDQLAQVWQTQVPGTKYRSNSYISFNTLLIYKIMINRDL